MAAERRVGAARRDAAASLAESFPTSVIVPVHNGAATLKRCLEAIRANDLRSAEVVVVDDGSSDDSAVILKQMQTDWPELRLVQRDQAGGPAAARNTGLEASRHPYLLFVDADVVVPAAAVRQVRETLRLYSHRPEVVGVLGVYSEDIPDDGFFSQYKNLYVCWLYSTTRTITPFVHTPVFCIRAEELRRLGGFDTRLRRAEDFRLGLQLAAAGKRVIVERRLAATHLKTYSAGSLLAEDWRRVLQLRQLPLENDERRLARGAHRWRRLLALLLPLPTVALAVVAFWWPPSAALAAATLALFFLAQLRFLRYLRRRRGWGFALRAALFSWLEMGWAQLAAAVSVLPGAAPRLSAAPGARSAPHGEG